MGIAAEAGDRDRRCAWEKSASGRGMMGHCGEANTMNEIGKER